MLETVGNEFQPMLGIHDDDDLQQPISSPALDQLNSQTTVCATLRVEKTWTSERHNWSEYYMAEDGDLEIFYLLSGHNFTFQFNTFGF